MSAASATKSKRPPRRPRAALFRLLADEQRLRALGLLSREELSVGELASLLKDGQPQVSRKLAGLREYGLVDSRREGTRTWLALSRAHLTDPVISEAVEAGKELCLANGSLARIPGVVAHREVGAERVFATPTAAGRAAPTVPEHLAHVAALSPVLPGRALALDIGTGEGLLLDVLAPLFERVIAVDKSRAQLARVAERVASRGFPHVSLFQGSFDDEQLLERIDALGGADLVFAARALHHAARPQHAVSVFARFLKPGGHLVILDYLQHQDETLRRDGGDVWLGFDASTIADLMRSAGLVAVGETPIPPSFHPAGLDAHLVWHSWVARKPAAKPTPFSKLYVT